MRQTLLLSALLITFFCGRGQITIIGHNMINHSPLKNTRITVKEGSITTRTLNTLSRSDFRVQLDFGKNYRIYFENSRSPLMFMEVRADNVPAEKFEYRMTYELNVPFVDRTDEDIDTTVFSKAFHRVIYNGRSKMVDDTVYNNNFARNVLKKPVPVTEAEKEERPRSLPSIVTGKICIAGKPKLMISNSAVSLLDKEGKVLKSTFTNRYGVFVFPQVHIDRVSMIRMDMNDAGSGDNLLALHTSANLQVATAKPGGGVCEWPLGQEQIYKLVDNQYTSNIGGKLVHASAKQKKFFANNTVYLSNKLNTVVQQTKTSKLGTFVFEGIKPGQDYLLGIDRTAVGAGEKIDLLNKDDQYAGTLDSIAGNRSSLRMTASHNKLFNDITVAEDDMKMDVKGTIFGDNVNNPIGNLKIILLNDQYEVIDSALTSDLGSFKFKYLPFLKRFYLSAENNDNILDVFQNILIYSSEENLIKIMTHQKGTKFRYQPVAAEITHLRNIEIDDPWLELLEPAEPVLVASTGIKGPPAKPKKPIVENILFETARYDINEASEEILDKIILVLNTNKALRIEIGAHTDSKGSQQSNMKLSELRALTVKNYITSAGIDASRIESRGYGETRLRNNCADNVPCSELEHAENRRIEFKIIGEQY